MEIGPGALLPEHENHNFPVSEQRNPGNQALQPGGRVRGSLRLDSPRPVVSRPLSSPPPPHGPLLFGRISANCKNSSGRQEETEPAHPALAGAWMPSGGSLRPGNGAFGLAEHGRVRRGIHRREGTPRGTESEWLGGRRNPIKGEVGSKAERQAGAGRKVCEGDGCAAAGRGPEAGPRLPVEARRQVMTQGQSRSPMEGPVGTHSGEAGVKVLAAGTDGWGREGGHPVSRF